MTSIILSTAIRYLLPLMLLFSVFILLRGHHEPGGGFVGGLIAASAYTLYAIAFGVEKARKILRAFPLHLIGVGLLFAISSGIIPLVSGKSFMTGMWFKNPLPVIGFLGTPVLFDTGVFLVVIGVVLTIIFSLAEEQ